MAGAFLVDCLIYVVILIWRSLREGGTWEWAVVTADVCGDPFVTASPPRVTLVYTYEFEGKRRYGSYDVLFFFSDTAQECAQFFVKGRHVRVRVNPENPDVSVIRHADLPAY
jgi:Protein of unknown function (DUF3592)